MLVVEMFTQCKISSMILASLFSGLGVLMKWHSMVNFVSRPHHIIDVPSMINFILNTTGASTLTYIGHSQGTVQSLAAFSSNADIASKVNLFIGKLND